MADKGMLSVIRDDSAFIQQMVMKYHYLHRWPSPLSLPFGYRLLVDGTSAAGDGRAWGVVVMKKPQHHRQRGLFGYDDLPTAWQVLDLARVWVHPDLQRRKDGHALCVFSQMVSLVLRRVQADWLAHHPPAFPAMPYHIRLIISYCQLDHHDGTAYRASGFKSLGLSRDGAKEVYVRRLRQPLKSWQPMQLGLIE